MSETFINHLKNINQLQGLIYQNLMETFNNLSENTPDYSDIGNITNVKQLKHLILSRLKTTTTFINSPQFKVACITCKAVRILGVLKYEIASSYLSDEQQQSALGEVISDYKVDKKYTENFHNAVCELKTNISKFISSQALRKQFILNNFCIQLLNKEKKLLEETFPENKNIAPPEWIKVLTQEELDKMTQQIIVFLENKDYEGFLKLTENK